MHINRKTLYLGVFLIAAGVAVLVARESDHGAIAQALGLWPVAIIAIGAGLILRGTRVSLAAGMVGAALPGLLLGGLVVAGPDVRMDCGQARASSQSTHDGAFNGPASVNLELNCGDLSVTTQAGTRWQAQTTDRAGLEPSIVATGSRLAIRSPERAHYVGLSWNADDWSIALPTDVPLDLDATVNAGHAVLNLAGARLGDLMLTVNAGDLQADLAKTTLRRLQLEVNAADASITLPASTSFSADFNVNAASLDVCVPTGLGLRIHQDGELSNTSYAGLVRSGDTWETPGYANAVFHADVTMSVNVGSVDVNPEGGCK
ncbi:MAG: hypothetical protein ABI555_02030 [Chloroflexota bacterium]